MFNSYEFSFAGESSLMYGLMIYDIDGNGQENVLDTAVGIRKFRKGYIAINTALWVLVLAVFVVMGVVIYHAWSTPVKGLAAVGILCVITLMALFAEYLYGRRVLKACDGIIQRLEEGA